MNVAEVMNAASETLLLVLYLSMPPIITAAGVGTLVALLQALTQIQEQTLSFAIKLTVVILVVFATASWLGGALYDFADRTFQSISTI